MAVLISAVALDRLGEPPNRFHPVRWLGIGIERLEPYLGGYIGGIVLTAAALTPPTALGLGIEGVRGPVALAASAAVLSLAFSASGLEKAVLGARGETLSEARAETSLLVSRDVSDMGRGQLNSSLLETVSENATDSFFTPLFYFSLLGLPGALAYRALDTLDSMVGYPEEGPGGAVPAILEDAATVVPAALALAPLSAAAFFAFGPRAVGSGLRSTRLYGGERPGFNGWVMAFYAGALGVSLEKPGSYRMNAGPLPTTRDVKRGVTLFRASILTSLPFFLPLLYLREVLV